VFLSGDNVSEHDGSWLSVSAEHVGIYRDWHWQLGHVSLTLERCSAISSQAWWDVTMTLNWWHLDMCRVRRRAVRDFGHWSLCVVWQCMLHLSRLAGSCMIARRVSTDAVAAGCGRPATVYNAGHPIDWQCDVLVPSQSRVVWRLGTSSRVRRRHFTLLATCCFCSRVPICLSGC